MTPFFDQYKRPPAAEKLKCSADLQLRTIKGKGKPIPLQAWTGPEGSRRLKFPDFKIIGTQRW